MFTRANVGECTRSAMPSPRASPFTNCVLPAPRSPDRPMTSPLSAARPHCSPRAAVSAALCEMYVAMGRQRSHALLVPDGYPLARLDPADARQREPRELLLPCVKQRHGIAAGDREQQFKVLAIGQRRLQGRFGGGRGLGGAARLPAD